MNIKNGFRHGDGHTAKWINWVPTTALWTYLIIMHGWTMVAVMLGWFTVCVVLNAIWEKSWKHGAARAFGIRSRRPFESSPSKS